jgi:hypothetical protein
MPDEEEEAHSHQFPWANMIFGLTFYLLLVLEAYAERFIDNYTLLKIETRMETFSMMVPMMDIRTRKRMGTRTTTRTITRVVKTPEKK